MTQKEKSEELGRATLTEYIKLLPTKRGWRIPRKESDKYSYQQNLIIRIHNLFKKDIKQ